MTEVTWKRLFYSRAPAATILIRLASGIVFLGEGIQKFMYPDALGVGRFVKIGIPTPEVMAPFVGFIEVVGGILLLVGLLTRLAAIPLIIDMVVAILSTKVPILIGRGYFLFAKPAGSKTGIFSMLHESRTDLSMLLGCAFLFIVGAGSLSLDAMVTRSRSER